MTAYIKDKTCTILDDKGKLVYLCPVHTSTDGTNKGMFSDTHLDAIGDLKDIEFRFADDTARDFTPTIPEIVEIISLLQPVVLWILSRIKAKTGDMKKAIEIINTTDGLTDSQKLLLITKIQEL